MENKENALTGEERLLKRQELMDRVCFSVREGNDFQALRAIRERNELGIPGLIDDPLSEWKYELTEMRVLLSVTLRSAGIPATLILNLEGEFTRRIHMALDVTECIHLTEEMVLRFCRESSRKEHSVRSSLVQSVLQIVDRDLSAPLTLQYLAGELNVNSSYLSSLFRREVGVTLTEYVTERRISYAADLLRTTQSPIKIIAKKAGIQDVQYFSRLFKKRIGVTPSRYREGE